MAKPRIFVSSTYYDLKHIRSSLDVFVESLGFESVLSEKGDIAFPPDMPLDESCYREVANTDIFVLIIGGRYGSETSDGDKKKNKEFYDKYESVTKKEFEEAIRKDIPTYVLIELSVHSEYQTYLRNREKKDVEYAHVDSVNIFRFIEEIMSLRRNNPTHTFEKFSDIESWLREQWSGLFRDLLKRMSDQQQFAELSQQVGELKDINSTLKTYIESVMTGATKEEASILIEAEKRRIAEKKTKEEIENNELVIYLMLEYGMSLEVIIEAAKEAKTATHFVDLLAREFSDDDEKSTFLRLLQNSSIVSNALNKIRHILDLPELSEPNTEASDD